MVQREVAVARIDQDQIHGGARRPFGWEAEVMGLLGDHPYIVTLHDAALIDSGCFLITQYMAGGDLATYCRSLWNLASWCRFGSSSRWATKSRTPAHVHGRAWCTETFSHATSGSTDTDTEGTGQRKIGCSVQPAME